MGTPNRPKPTKEAAKAARAAKLAEVHLWDRRKGEEDEHYAWFLAYLNLPPSDRSVCGAFRSFNRIDPKASVKNRHPSRFWWYISAMFEWKPRALAWDVWMQQKELDAFQRRRMQFVGKKGDAAFKAMERAMEMLDANAPKDVKVVRLPDGTTKMMVVPDGYSFDDAAKLLTAAVKIGNDALGLTPMPDQVIQQQDGPGSGSGKSRIAISQELLAEITAESPEPESMAEELRQQYDQEGGQ